MHFYLMNVQCLCAFVCLYEMFCFKKVTKKYSKHFALKSMGEFDTANDDRHGSTRRLKALLNLLWAAETF